MNTKIIIAVLIILALAMSFILYFDVFNLNKKGRPEYCDSNGCIPKEVFRKLLVYPEDFEEVKYLMVLTSENVSKKYSDEYYYKQPEFYTDSFVTNGMGYYTKLSKPQNFSYMNVAGYGTYPSELKLKVNEGEYELASYLHASWGVVKYQGLGLKVNYPENSSGCFDATLIPRAVLLGRTYLSFDLNWAEKIKINLNVNENCPKGDYLITISATNVPEDFEEEWIKLYGNGYISLGMVRIEPLIKILLTKT
jgi:hypothetical protein